MAFTAEAIEETTTVTDPDGKVVSQTTKEIPFDARADGQAFGSSLQKEQGLADFVGQYASRRYGAERYASQEAAGNATSHDSGVSVEA